MKIETLIIGGGQAGLALSYWLSQQGREHLVLEQASQGANAWRNDRWDSFTLVTPNWTMRMPGAEYAGPEPDGFMTRADVIAYLEKYIERFAVPLRYNVRVEAVTSAGTDYQVQTTSGAFLARNVVVATGLFQKPKIPLAARTITANVMQIHSGQYRNPYALPPGAVLVVGSAQSGSQIADELLEAGRTVYLSTCSSSGRLPRRYRGRDGMQWFYDLGGLNRTVDKLPSPRAKFAGNPHLSGKGGGRTLNWHQFAQAGAILLGRFANADGNELTFASDLQENLARADKFAADFTKNVDTYIEKNGLEAPLETLPDLRTGYEVEASTQVNLTTAGISTVIWALGYTFDFSLVQLPVTDGDGFPMAQRGVTAFPGLYFLGLPWLHTQKSGLFLGVGEDAQYVAEHICGRTLG